MSDDERSDKVCETCGGAGSLTENVRCPTCAGEGKVDSSFGDSDAKSRRIPLDPLLEKLRRVEWANYRMRPDDLKRLCRDAAEAMERLLGAYAEEHSRAAEMAASTASSATKAIPAVDYDALLTEFETLVLDANDPQLPHRATLPISKRLNEVRAKLQSLARRNTPPEARECSKCRRTPPFPGGTRCQDLQCPLIQWSHTASPQRERK